LEWGCVVFFVLVLVGCTNRPIPSIDEDFYYTAAEVEEEEPERVQTTLAVKWVASTDIPSHAAPFMCVVESGQRKTFISAKEMSDFRYEVQLALRDIAAIYEVQEAKIAVAPWPGEAIILWVSKCVQDECGEIPVIRVHDEFPTYVESNMLMWDGAEVSMFSG